MAFSATPFTTKADKFLGLDKIGSESSIRPQKEGYLLKKPFSKGYAGGTWRKRYFVIKDSFLFWYERAPSTKTGPFNTKPKGCLPLGGCSVRPDAKDESIFDVAHPEFQGNVLVLKASDIFEAREWVSLISVGRRATWENAILGSAMIEKMRAKGTGLEKEKAEIYEKMELEAARIQKELEEQEILMERELEQLRLHDEEIERISKEEKELLTKNEELKESREQEEARLKEERAARERAENLLSQAQEALSELEEAFKLRMIDASGKAFEDNDEVEKNVGSLRDFFESKSKLHVAKQQATDHTKPRKGRLGRLLSRKP